MVWIKQLVQILFRLKKNFPSPKKQCFQAKTDRRRARPLWHKIDGAAPQQLIDANGAAQTGRVKQTRAESKEHGKQELVEAERTREDTTRRVCWRERARRHHHRWEFGTGLRDGR